MFCFRRLGPMRRAAAAAWSVKPQAISIKLEPANLRSQNLCRGNHTSAAIDAKQLFGQRSSVFREIRSFGSLRSSSLSGGKSVNGAEQQMSPWDEVEAQRPLAPDPYDGTYQMPKGAPDPRNLSRQQFHQFMHGKPQRFSKELKVAAMGISLTMVGIGVTWLTAYIMRPDDFEWVEEERRRIEEAKARIQKKIEQANKSLGENK